MKSLLTRRVVAASAAMTLVAGGALAVVTAPATAAASRPALKLEAARKVVTLESYEGVAYLELGMFAVAGNRPFEIRAYRPGYDQPITALSAQPGPDRLLSGLVKDFDGLTDFYTLTVKNAKKKTVHKSSVDFCPNVETPVRRRPDAPASSPYPGECAGNPYSTGAVWGVQKGWGVPALEARSARLKPGSYTASLVITPAYRSALGIAAADGTVTVKLKVVAGTDDDEDAVLRRSAPPAPAPAPAQLSGRAIAPRGPRPDLRSLPAWGIAVAGGRYLTFSATVWNAGPSPLVVDGFRDERNENRMKAYQYFFDGAGKQVGYTRVGTMAWDARDGHDHWHFTDFATYRLLDSRKKRVVRSQKEAFCLANTDAVDYTVPKANWRPDNTELASACGERDSLGVREVLDTGSGDTYDQDLPGQSFDLKGLKNGVYYIEVKANPDKRLHERSTANNVSYRKVTVSGAAGRRKVVAQKVGVIVEPAPSIDDQRRAAGR